MVVIVASLFLPFQPQFEISQVKEVLGTDESIGGNSATEGGVRAKLCGAQGATGTPAEVASDDGMGEAVLPPLVSMMSSQQLLDNLTSNANSSTTGTPSNPVYNHANASVEEFFLVPVARNLDGDGGSGVYSTGSSPSGEFISGFQSGLCVGSGTTDSTANLLKSVNKSLLYQPVLARSVSNSVLECSRGSPSNINHGAGGTTLSRQLLELNSNVGSFPKDRGQRKSLGSIRRGANKPHAGTIGVRSNLKYPITVDQADDTDRTVVDSAKDNITGSSEHQNYVSSFGSLSKNFRFRARLVNSRGFSKNTPWRIVSSVKGNGGLRNALSTAVLEKTITQPVTWIGTIGVAIDHIPKDTLDSITHELEENYNSRAVIPDDTTLKGAYKNFCKQILWPTLNYQIPDNPNSKAFEDHSWNYYQDLNQLFADKIIETYQEGDTIWIHDYHLMLVPGMVRKRLSYAKIGFFLHISFPSSEVFRCFAQREKILEGMLGANSIGFQTEEYARHFQQTANGLLMSDVDTHLLKYKGRIIAIESIPIGIDAFDLEIQVKSEPTELWRNLIRERWKGKKLIVSRDQFDRIRGLKKKMLAYEQFLKDNPQYIYEVVLIQICLGSICDSELERDVMKIVDRINAMSNDISISQPVVFLHQDLQFSQYLALGCEADMFLITTMREGMNLTCHELIICSKERNASLVLSEFTGSAHVLSQGSLLINPWDIKQVSKVIKDGLELSKEERRRRWKKLFKSVITHDSGHWIVSSLNSISNSWEANNERSKVFNLSLKKLKTSYAESKKHLFVLKLSEPLNARMFPVLTELSTKNIVYVINSFSRSTIERMFSHVPHIGLIAENGAFVKVNGKWYNLVEDVSWMQDIIKVIENKVERLPGSYCRVGETTIEFHTENAEDKDRVSNVIGDAIVHVNTLFSDSGIHAYLHKGIVFVQQSGLSVKAINFLLNQYNSLSNETSSSSPLDSPTNSPTTGSIPMLSSPCVSGSKPLTGNAPISIKNRSINKVDFISVSGSSSPIIELLFQYVNQLIKNADIARGFTIAYGDTITTYAKEHVEGLNELFGILDKLVKQT